MENEKTQDTSTNTTLTVAESRQDYKKIKNIVYKGVGYRMVAAIIDFAIALLVGIFIGVFLSNIVIVPIAKATGAVNDTYNQYISDQLTTEEENCGLFALNPSYSGGSGLSKYVALSDSSVKDSYSTYDKYETQIVKYYTVYLNSDSSFVNASKKGTFTNYYYNVFILGLNDEQGLYTTAELDDRDAFIINNGLFEYQKDGETTLYNEIAKPNSNLYSNGELTSESQTKLLQYYNNASAETVTRKYTIDGADTTISYHGCIYEAAMEHWIYQSNDPSANASIFFILNEWTAVVTNYANYQVTYPILGAIIITWILAYFVMPIILKNGRTLGKMFFKSAVVNKYGYSVTVPQMLLRSLFPLILVVVIYLIAAFSSMILFYVIMLVLLLVSYTLVIFNKEHKSIHDFVAGTAVIDSEKSTWFKSAIEEEEYQSHLDEEFKSENEENNSNVTSVKDEVLNNEEESKK